MKKLLLLVSFVAVLGLGAKSIKIKVRELRNALATHADSEIKSWTLLKDLDKRMHNLERKASLYQHDNPQYESNSQE